MYMHKPVSVLENETQTDHQIPVRISDLVLISKKKNTCHIVDFVVPVDHSVKIKGSEKNTWFLP